MPFYWVSCVLSDVTCFYALYTLCFCPFQTTVDDCGFQFPDTTVLVLCKLPLVGRTQISCCLIKQASHFIPFTSIKMSFPKLAFFHYYLVNLPHTSDFSFLDWGKKLSGVMFFSSNCRIPAFLLDTKSLLLCHFDTYPASPHLEATGFCES